jgi:RNA polymerase sigma-70 factor (ECF subfamily)
MDGVESRRRTRPRSAHVGWMQARKPKAPETVTEPTATPEARISALFERLRLPVYRYLVVVLGETGEAEEIAQDTFLRLYDQFREGRTPDDVRGWIFRVAHNLAQSVVRRRRHVAPLDDADIWTALCERMVTAPDQERRLVSVERSQAFAAALGTLTNQERQCLALRAEGLRYREIAELLEITHAAAVDTLRRGVAKMTRALHD